MTHAGHLDRLLGWHLLVPPRPGRRVHLQGVPQGAAEHWTGMRGEEVTEYGEEADFRLFWDPVASAIRPGPEGCAVIGGHGVLRERGRGGRLHALLSPKEPRLVLPLHNRTQVLRGLALHRPGRRTARAAVAAASVAARLGVTAPLRRRLLWISGGEIPSFGADAVLYLGTADANRKTTILPVAGDRILKHGVNNSARAALRNEAEALRAMSSTSLSESVPQLLGLIEDEASTTLEQEYRPRQPRLGAAVPRAEISRFLARMTYIERERRPVAGLAQGATVRVPHAVADGGGSVTGHRSHGDFAPWNLTWTNRGLFVFDWEESASWAPAFSDAFYFVVSQALHVEHAPNPQKVARDAQKFATYVARAAQMDCDQIPLCWALWLTIRHEKQPAPLLSRMLEMVGGLG